MIARKKAVAIIVAKLLVTTGFLWWLARYFDFHQVRNTLENVSPGLIVIAIGLHVTAYLIGAIRWWLLFRHLTVAVPFHHILPSYYLGVFFNNVLPSSVGGDLARSAKLYVAGMSGSALVGSAMVDRLLGVSGLIAIGVIALLVSSASFVNQFAWPVLGVGVVILAAVASVLTVPDWTRRLDTSVGGRWRRVHAVLSCFPKYRMAPGLLLGGFALSMLSQSLIIAVFLIFAHTLQIEVPMFQFVAVLILVFLAQSLPISLGGLGPREGAMMSLLLLYGVESNTVLSLSVLYLAVLWVSALPGVFVLMYPQRLKGHATDTG